MWPGPDPAWGSGRLGVLSPGTGAHQPCPSSALRTRDRGQGWDGAGMGPPTSGAPKTRARPTQGPSAVGQTPPRGGCGTLRPPHPPSSAPPGARDGARAVGRGRGGQRLPPPQIKSTPMRARRSWGSGSLPAAISPPGDVPRSLPLAPCGHHATRLA